MIMYKVEVKYTNNERGEFVTTVRDLFSLCWCLNKSSSVDQFRVEGRVSSDFGWGNMSKWVVDFTWSKEE